MRLFNGRINRKQFVVSTVILSLVNGMFWLPQQSLLATLLPELFAGISNISPWLIVAVLIGISLACMAMGIVWNVGWLVIYSTVASMWVEDFNALGLTLFVGALVNLTILILYISYYLRRLRDLGFGRIAILTYVGASAFLPLVIFIALLKGTPGVNRYGPPNDSGVFGKLVK